MNAVELVRQLRTVMFDADLDGWLIPRSDEHQGEYVAPYAERLAWSTGFTGSAGLAIILRDKAAVFVDGRYTLQAKNEVDEEAFEIVYTFEKSPSEWLAENAHGLRIGFDPWLHTEAELMRYKKATRNFKTTFIAHRANLVDEIWHDQPAKPTAKVVDHPVKYAGETRNDKAKRLAEELRASNADAAVITNLDSVAWLLNIRGEDIPCSPLALAYAILFADGSVHVFIDRKKVASTLKMTFGKKISLFDYEDFEKHLGLLNGKRVLFDPRTAPIQVLLSLERDGAEVVPADDICLLPKACKNEAELEGTRQAHIRDGAALCEFLAWIHYKIDRESISEIDAAERLLKFRQEQNLFQGPSFETISGTGPNGAVVHYRVSPKTNRLIHTHDVYLVDSGGQYLDGTTDVTRTIVFSKPDAEKRDKFTRVLKGHIALASAVFPHGTKGHQLDVLARQYLWDAGVDYEHGTGHGVGSYLCVHEGPQRIAKVSNDATLLPGMILSNEPGYYQDNAYGIRIENLVIVQEVKIPHAERKMYGFETVTMAPICRDFIEPTLLSEAEKDWLNTYHRIVRAKLTPLVNKHTLAWLEEATAPIA